MKFILFVCVAVLCLGSVSREAVSQKISNISLLQVLSKPTPTFLFPGATPTVVAAPAVAAAPVTLTLTPFGQAIQARLQAEAVASQNLAAAKLNFFRTFGQ